MLRSSETVCLALIFLLFASAPVLADCEAVRVENTGVLRADYATYIVGRAVNESDEDLVTLAVGFALYDEEGNQVGDATDTTGSLESGETWTFKALVSEENFVDYALNLLHCP